MPFCRSVALDIAVAYDAFYYDDDQELTAYIWHNYRNLLTPLEALAERTLLAESKAQHTSDRMAAILRERWVAMDDPDVAAALAGGSDVFRNRVRERILKECDKQIVINRCPQCSRLVATPKAHQCLWCGHDWH